MSHHMDDAEKLASATESAVQQDNDNEEQIARTGHPDKPSAVAVLVRHWRLIGVMLLVLALGGTYLWKNVAVSRAKAHLTRQAASVITAHNESWLRLAVVPLVWTVRSEMLRGNHDQINQYLAQFVREPNMKEVLVAGADGRIIAATNKKREGAIVHDFFPPEVPKADTITVTTRPDGMFLVAAPIMGLNDKRGVLILVAAPPAYTLETPSR